MTDAAPILPPRYRVQRVLGKGGMGKVYLAHDAERGEQVAVKVLAVSPQQLEAAAARFKREARAQSAITSRHMVQIYDAGLECEPPYLAMEYVAGRDIEHDLKDEGGLPLDEVQRFVREVAEALDQLHRSGVIHRDLKPSNIMRRQGDGSAVLMDLGLAKVEGATALTATGQLVGTPLYLPPEALTDTHWSPQADVYQLGAIAFECLDGKPMIPGQTMDEVVSALVAGQHRELPASLGLPAYVAEAIQIATLPDPEERFQSASEFARALAGDQQATTRRVGTAQAKALDGTGVLGGAPTGAVSERSRWPWMLALFGGVAVGLLWSPSGTPVEPRWRIVGDTLEVSYLEGGARDIRVEIGDRLAKDSEKLADGRSRILIPKLPPGEALAARLVWQGGNGPKVEMTATRPALEESGRLLSSRRVEVRVRRACRVRLGKSGWRPGVAGQELVLPVPVQGPPLPALEWEEDGVRFRRDWTWADLYALGVAQVEALPVLGSRSELIVRTRAGEDNSNSRRSAQATWRQLGPWVPELLISDLDAAARSGVWRAWQWAEHVAGIELALDLLGARLELPPEGAGARLASLPETSDGGGEVSLYPALARSEVVLAPPGAIAGLSLKTAASVSSIEFPWPIVGGEGKQLVTVAFQLRKWRRVMFAKLTAKDPAGHPFRVDFWHPNGTRQAAKYTGWVAVRLPRDLLPPAGTPMLLEAMPMGPNDHAAASLTGAVVRW